jgi:hypothetical protein
MLTAEPSTYDMFLFQNICISRYENISKSHVDGSAVNKTVLYQKCKHVIC